MTEDSDAFFKNVLDSLFDGVYMLDRERRITYWNPGAERLTGFTPGETIGKACASNLLVHVDRDGMPLCASELCPAARAMREGVPLECDVFAHHKDGHRVPLRTRVSPLRDAAGNVVGAVEVFSDNTAALAVAEEVSRLERAALLDPLTGIGNRRLAELALHASLDELQRYGWPFAVALVDVDQFKSVNDTHGHEAGDAVLRMVARSLAAGVRSSDTVARWGGDEFIAVLRDVANPLLPAVAEKLCRLVRQSFVGGDSHSIRVAVSIGATVALTGDDVESLVKRADDLLYASKSAGRDCVSTDAVP